jgi:archaellum component FlaC
MASPRGLVRQVNQNTNDILALYDLQKETNETVKKIAEVQQEHGRKFEAIDSRLDGVEGRLDGVEGRLGGVEGRLGGVESQLGGVEGRLDSHGKKLDEILGILRPAQ